MHTYLFSFILINYGYFQRYLATVMLKLLSWKFQKLTLDFHASLRHVFLALTARPATLQWSTVRQVSITLLYSEMGVFLFSYTGGNFLLRIWEKWMARYLSLTVVSLTQCAPLPGLPRCYPFHQKHLCHICIYREREHYNFTNGFPRISFPTTVSLARKIQPFRSKSEFDTLADVINMHGGGPGGVAQCFNVTYDG